MGAIKYYFGTVPVPYRLERDLRGTVPRATRPGRDRDGRGKKRLFFSNGRENQSAVLSLLPALGRPTFPQGSPPLLGLSEDRYWLFDSFYGV